MARYIYGSQRNLGGKWISVALTVVIGALAIILVLWYNPFARNESPETQAAEEIEKPVEPKIEPKVEPKVESPKVVQSKQTDVPKPTQPVQQPPATAITPPFQTTPPASVSNKEIASQLTPSSEAAKLINDALKSLEGASPQIIDAREKLNEALLLPLNASQQKLVKDKLSELSDKWLFGKTVYPNDKHCSSYRVGSGDLLANIANDNNVPYMILQRINDIPRPELLQAGQNIKIVHGPFNARIYRSTFTMDLYLKNTFVRSFPVGLGKQGHETPTGLWVVKKDGKLIKPPWTDPDTGKRYESDDPNYPLGSRWIALEGIEGDAKGREGFAIHGTKDPKEIGTAQSRGCIRLYNGDAILAYDVLMAGVSKVEIKD